MLKIMGRKCLQFYAEMFCLSKPVEDPDEMPQTVAFHQGLQTLLAKVINRDRNTL